jgi:ATP-dependent RNA helicase MRH4, mitochondrial
MDWKRRRLRKSRWSEEIGTISEVERKCENALRTRVNHVISNSDWVRNDLGKTLQRDKGRITRNTAESKHKDSPGFPAFPTAGQQSQRSPEFAHKKAHDNLPVLTEFYHPLPQSIIKRPHDPINATHQELVTKFTSPPLMSGLLSRLTDILGPTATPTPIQSLSLKWILDSPNASPANNQKSKWKHFLLASETGSGKSIAYLLPMLQNLKLSELNTADPTTSTSTTSKRPLNPRALILTPTHELARQLSGFAKALLHEVKLRVSCASRPNVKNTRERNGTTQRMLAEFEEEFRKSAGHGMEGDVEKEKFPVDIVVGTSMKLLEMVRGRGWDQKEGTEEESDIKTKLRRGRDKLTGFGKWRNPPEMGLANVEWVVVDEADVLFGMLELPLVRRL